MDREQVIEWAARVAALMGAVSEQQRVVMEATAALVEAQARFDVAVEELTRVSNDSGGRERNTEHHPVSFSSSTRPNRWTGGVQGGRLEYLYHSPVYATLGRELGMGTQDTHVPMSGKRYKCVWLTVEEHDTILALANERYPKGDE